MTSCPTIGVRALAKSLGGKSILRGVDLVCNAGQITAILGPNGAGKSTLLRTLVGLISPDQGQVMIGDRNSADMTANQRARMLGFLPQTPDIAWAVDVETLVGLGRTPHLGAFGATADDQARVAQALDRCGLSDFARRDVTTLSGGERARVLIARVLAGEPDWLLVDEPLGGLDPGHRLDVIDLFKDFARKGGGVVITLHDLDSALRMADRIVVLAAGQVIADGAPMDALTPAVLAQAYGIKAHMIEGPSGPMIDIIGRI